MIVAVIGVTGRVGKRVAAGLASKGVTVYGGNRRLERIPESTKKVLTKISRVDTGYLGSVLDFVRGADVVFLAAAPTREHPEDYPLHGKNVIEACKQAGVKRLVAMSNYKALKAPDGRPMLEAEPPHPVFFPIEAAFDEEKEIFRRETELDWLLVAGGADTKPYAPASGNYRVQEEILLVRGDKASFKDSSEISLDDLTDFVTKEILSPKYRGVLLCVAY